MSLRTSTDFLRIAFFKNRNTLSYVLNAENNEVAGTKICDLGRMSFIELLNKGSFVARGSASAIGFMNAS